MVPHCADGENGETCPVRRADGLFHPGDLLLVYPWLNISMPVIVANSMRNDGLGSQGFDALGAKRYLAVLADLLGLLHFTPVGASPVFRTA